MTLDEFIDESIRRSRAKGYHPSIFIDMRQKFGAIAATKRLVETSEPQSGFKRLKQLGLLDWSLEAAVLKFPNEFPDKKTQEYAKARLDGIFDA